MAFQHPFIVWGSPKTLKYLHDRGFETFNHTIDESYDNVLDNTARLASIVQSVDRLYQQFKQGKSIFDDAVTKEKIMHNYHRFYDPQLTTAMFKHEVIEPIIEFV